MLTMHVRLYSRPGCHLCEETLTDIETLREEFDFLLEEINIDDDPALKERLGHQIPVVTVDGGHKVTNPVTKERLHRSFSRAFKVRQESQEQA